MLIYTYPWTQSPTRVCSCTQLFVFVSPSFLHHISVSVVIPGSNLNLCAASMEPAHHLCQAVDSITSFGRVAQFTRPASPHPNPQFQFAYSQAKLPQLDFTRKRTQNLRAKSNVGQLEPAGSAEKTTDPHLHPNGTQQLESTEYEEPHVSKNAAGTAAPKLPTKHTTCTDSSEIVVQSGPATSTTEPSIVLSSSTVKPSIGNIGPSPEIAEPSPATSPVQQKFTSQKERHHHTRARKASITGQSHTAPCSTVSRASSNGELMGILLSRFEAEQHSREELRASQLAKDIEIQDLKGVSQTLYEQLQELKDRERVLHMELSGLNKLKPQWQHRIQNMNVYVQSLSEDHQKLREEAKEIRGQQKDIQIEKASLEAALKEAHYVVDQDRSRTKKILAEAQHEMELLEQTVENHKRQLSQNADLLIHERERSEGLANAISKITTNYQDLTILFKNDRDAVIGKLGDLIQRSDNQIANAPQPQEDLKPIIDQCLQELRELDVVKQKDFLSLKRSLNSYATTYASTLSSLGTMLRSLFSLTESIQKCGSTTHMTNEGQQHHFSEIQRMISNLNDTINVKDALGEQLMDLREVKATIRERLQAAEASLVIVRQHTIGLEIGERTNLRRISELEAEVMRLQAKGSELGQVILRLEESELCNRNLEREIANTRNETLVTSESLAKKQEEITNLAGCLAKRADEISTLNTCLEKKVEDITGLNRSLGKATEVITGLRVDLESRSVEVRDLKAHVSKLQAELEEARRNAANLADQKVECELQSAEKAEKMRKQMSQAASLELARLESEHLKELQQLRQQRAVAEDRAEQQRMAAENKTDQLIKQLDKLHAERAVNQSNTPRSMAREAMAPPREPASPAIRTNRPHENQVGGRPDIMPWQPVRLNPRGAYPDWSGPVPSTVKRTAPEESIEAQPPKRVRKLVSQGLGPVIPDSVSPNRPRGRGNRKQAKGTIGKNPPKEDCEYRFSQELEME